MKRRHIFQMGVLSLFGMGVLLSMVAFDPPGLHRKQELLSLSVILRGADSASWPARQGMEQAAVDLGAELRFLALDRPNHAGEQSSLLAREAEGGADGIILVPADTEALSGDVRRAAAETTVVTIESDMSASGAVACISADNAALGEALGRAAINGVPLGGTVLLLDSVPGSSGMAQRLSSWRKMGGGRKRSGSRTHTTWASFCQRGTAPTRPMQWLPLIRKHSNLRRGWRGSLKSRRCFMGWAAPMWWSRVSNAGRSWRSPPRMSSRPGIWRSKQRHRRRGMRRSRRWSRCPF